MRRTGIDRAGVGERGSRCLPRLPQVAASNPVAGRRTGARRTEARGEGNRGSQKALGGNFRITRQNAGCAAAPCSLLIYLADINATVVSSMRLEKPHSLSYQDDTF